MNGRGKGGAHGSRHDARAQGQLVFTYTFAVAFTTCPLPPNVIEIATWPDGGDGALMVNV
jgi:hypothetical protein